MSKILVISSYFHPDRGGGSAVNTDLCEGLASLGNDVTVWTSYSHYPEWQDKTKSNSLKISNETLGQINIIRFGLYIPQNPNSIFQRVLYEGTFFLSTLRMIFTTKKYDVIMAFCPLVASVGIATIASAIYRKPLWLNVQDLAAEAATAGGIIKANLLVGLLKRFQSFLFNRANIWSSISPVMVERLKTINKRNQKILHLPNWLNKSLEDKISDLPNKIGRAPNTTIKLLYAGNFGRKQNLINLLNSLKLIKINFSFHLNGDGAMRQQIYDWFESNTDDRFILGDFLEEDDFAAALHACDFFILPEIGNSGASFLPSKLTAVMATATPTICISDKSSPLGIELKTSNAGVHIEWNEINEISNIFKNTLSSKHLFTTWQKNAISRSQYFSRKRIIESFNSEIQSLH